MEKLIDITNGLIAPFLDLLLKDKATKKNIIWATDTYAELGEGFADTDQIQKIRLLQHVDVIKPRIQKSWEAQQARTRKKAEVFTPAWLCNTMNNHCDAEWFGRGSVFNAEAQDHSWNAEEKPVTFPPQKRRKIPLWQRYVDSRRLEITCGEAPYLASRYDVSTGEMIYPLKNRIGQLDRKLRVVNENAATYELWIKWAVRAVEACYGYEYQGDNLLVARINLLLTFIEYHRERWQENPAEDMLKKIINRITWNIWQMDGLKDIVPFGKLGEQYQPISLFEMSFEQMDDEEPEAVFCKIYDWRRDNSIVFNKLKEKRAMGKKIFDFVIGNPPYQKESSQSVSKTNGQKPMTNIFQYFQEAADKVTNDASVLIFPGGGGFINPEKECRSLVKDR